MQEIIPGVYGFSGLVSGRVYAIKDPDGLTLIDTGLALAPARILRQLASAGYQPTDIRRILITPDTTMNDTVFNRLTQFSLHAFDSVERVDESSESGRLFLQFQPPETHLANN